MKINHHKIKEIFWAIVFVFCGFSTGYLSQHIHFKNGKETIVPKEVKGISKVSVAINESSEMLIIDKVTGEYQTYSDTIGMAIFKLYANKIYQDNLEITK